jgi:hypothetical protein
LPPADIARLGEEQEPDRSRPRRSRHACGLPRNGCGAQSQAPYKVFAFAPTGRRSVFASYAERMTDTPASMTYADYLGLEPLLSAHTRFPNCTMRFCSSSSTRPRNWG